MLKIFLLWTIFLVTLSSSGLFVNGDVTLGDQCDASNGKDCTATCIGGVCCKRDLLDSQSFDFSALSCLSDNQCCYNKQFPKIYKCINGRCTKCLSTYRKCELSTCRCCGQKSNVTNQQFCEKLKKGSPCKVSGANDCKSTCDKNGFCM